MFLINIINAENHFCFLGYFLFYKVKSTEFIQNKTFLLHYKCIFFYRCFIFNLTPNHWMDVYKIQQKY